MNQNKINELNQLKSDDIIQFNSSAEIYFKEQMCELLKEFRGKISFNECIAEIAFRLNVSVVTSKRYLTKHLTVHAQFEKVNGFVQCKIHNHFPKIRVIKRK